MNETPEMKEQFLQDDEAIQILQLMVDQEKETVLNLIREGALLKAVLRKTESVDRMREDPVVQERMSNLSPEVEMELGWQMMGYDPGAEHSEWTEAEAEIFNNWWETTFPDEQNPIMLEQAPDEEEARLDQELMHDPDEIYRLLH